MELIDQILTHPRNQVIEFFEDSHTYFYKKDIEFNGITSLLSEHTPFVDWDKKAKAQAKRLGIDPIELRNSWKQKGVDSAARGTAIHKSIEDYVNLIEYNDEFSFHLDLFHENMDLYSIEPVVCEWCIYDERIKRASMIDIVGIRDNKIVIVDTKTMVKPIDNTPYTKNETFLYPFNTIPNTKFHKFSLQVGFYKYWVSLLYGIEVSEENYIFHINDEKGEMIPVQDTQTEIDKYYEYTLGKK